MACSKIVQMQLTECQKTESRVGGGTGWVGQQGPWTVGWAWATEASGSRSRARKPGTALLVGVLSVPFPSYLNVATPGSAHVHYMYTFRISLEKTFYKVG